MRGNLAAEIMRQCQSARQAEVVPAGCYSVAYRAAKGDRKEPVAPTPLPPLASRGWSPVVREGSYTSLPLRAWAARERDATGR
jgi:hypothetical protein